MGTVCAKPETSPNSKPSTSPVYAHHGSFEAAMGVASKSYSSRSNNKDIITVVQIVPVDEKGLDIKYTDLVANMNTKAASTEAAFQLSKILKRIRKVRIVFDSSAVAVKGRVTIHYVTVLDTTYYVTY